MFQSLKHWLKFKETQKAVKYGEVDTSGVATTSERTTERTSGETTTGEVTTGDSSTGNELIRNEHSLEDRDRLNRLQGLIGSPINPN
ncbi:MAG: hypothetical protein EBR93_01745, partial [Bacteroidetes bacterium]|nr:hypothetical protein [Bacteroidota bacterium]